MRVITVIPARFGAQRFPGKPLADLLGKPMIEWVYQSAKKAKGVSVTGIATDDERIQKAIVDIGGQVWMTSSACQSGTDRLAEVAQKETADIFVNVQGDEPLIEPEVIEKTLALVLSGKFEMASAMIELESEQELQNPNCVKVVTDINQKAIYFSRFPIPYSRNKVQKKFACHRHLGIYVYRRETLLKLSTLKPSVLELGESLEQLRALENGISIGMAKVNMKCLGVDVPEDLEAVKKVLKSRGV